MDHNTNQMPVVQKPDIQKKRKKRLNLNKMKKEKKAMELRKMEKKKKKEQKRKRRRKVNNFLISCDQLIGNKKKKTGEGG
jgi:hypothetical protein